MKIALTYLTIFSGKIIPYYPRGPPKKAYLSYRKRERCNNRRKERSGSNTKTIRLSFFCLKIRMSIRIRRYLFIFHLVMLTQRVYSVRFLSRGFCSQPTPLLKGLSVDLKDKALRKEFPNLLSKVTPADVQRIQSTILSGSYKLSPFVGKVMNEGVEHKTRPWSHIVNTCVQYPDGSYKNERMEISH